MALIYGLVDAARLDAVTYGDNLQSDAVKLLAEALVWLKNHP